MSVEAKTTSSEVITADPLACNGVPTSSGPYRLYKRRWVGVFAMFMLEAVAAAAWPWFGPISNNIVRDFGFTLDEVNWLGNIVSCRYGVKRCCDIATALILLSAWVRFAGTSRSLPKGGAYALILFGQLLSPAFSDTRTSILALAILSTAIVPLGLLITEAPPTPPSFSGSRIPSPSIVSLVRAAAGLSCPPEAYMTWRERSDFIILVSVFSTFVAASSPYGYSDNTSGYIGAAMLLSGIVAAIVTSPIFDRVLTHHLGVAVRTLCPIIGVAWLSLIWAVKPHNVAALFAIFIVIGVCSITLLPVAIELGVEMTRNPDGSSAVMQGALRASHEANPPQNMHRTIIFNGVWLSIVAVLVFFLQGKQTRRELDERMYEEQGMMSMKPDPAVNPPSQESSSLKA
ncbi:hypothetical protein BJV77DRAFT_999502 [Russula vinacea]|nr:hypothetical protein BJV77DRAFT_999502 [Russula vinacea]